MTRPLAGLFFILSGLLAANESRASDGAYGRLEGDIAPSIELGVSAAVAEWGSSASLAARTGLFYLHSVGLVMQYNDGLGRESQPIARSLSGGIEIRPLFLGRFAQDMQQGPAHLDLFADSFGLGMALYRSWSTDRHCQDAALAVAEIAAPLCRDFGMELNAGVELPLLPRFNSPFIALRAALRWSLAEADSVFDRTAPTGLFTLTLGYRHVLSVNVVEAGDRAFR